MPQLSTQAWLSSSLGLSPGCVTLGKFLTPLNLSHLLCEMGILIALREVKDMMHRKNFDTAWHKVALYVAIMLLVRENCVSWQERLSCRVDLDSNCSSAS